MPAGALFPVPDEDFTVLSEIKPDREGSRAGPGSVRMIRPRRTTPSRARSFLSVAGFAAALLFTRASLADHYRVPSGSMEPTIEVEDHVVVLKAAYGLRAPLTDAYLLGPRTPARGDVVVLTSPDDGIVLLKRVVAVAGDMVSVTDGHVNVTPARGSSTSAREGVDFAISLDFGGGPNLLEQRVPDGKMLVMGDNRGNSRDGRTFGFVDVSSVLGQATAVMGKHGVRGL